MEKEVKRLEWLVDEVNKHSYNYYVLDNPTISDADFDKLYDELVNLENELGYVLPNSPTKRVGGDVLDGFVKRTHKFKMYSLNKSKTKDEVLSFLNDIKKIEPNASFTLGYKYDGLTLILSYKDGIFQSATTRGNGEVGEDVTLQVKTIKTVPLKIKFKGELIVSGEGIITFANLEKYNSISNEPLKNARNAVSGAIRNLDPKETAKRNLDFVCYNVIYAEGKNFKTQEEMNEFIKENNFFCEPYQKTVENIDQIWKEIEKIDKIKTELGFLIDGMVIKLNEIDKREDIGYTVKFPKWALAFKFEPQEVTSILNNVVWQVGRTGKVTPIAEIEPIELAGATVKRATLNNYSDILRKKVLINSRVFVRRSNEVIPEILGLAEELPNSKKIEKPIYCPCCNSELIEKNVLLFCPNTNGCKEQVVDRLAHFASRNAMNIEGVSEQIINQLYECLHIYEPAQIYSLTKEDLLTLPKFKEKKAENILNSIKKSKNVDFSNFINAIGIPTIGEKTAKDLAKRFGSLENLINTNMEDLQKIEDMGELMSSAVVEFFNDQYNKKIIENLLLAGINIKESKNVVGGIFEGLSFVLTGTLSISRDEATKIIEENGGRTTSKVSKKTDYLLLGENPGSKLKEAQKLNVKIINEQEFLNMTNKE